LWLEVTSALDLDARDRGLLLETSRCLDQLDVLDGLVRQHGPMLPDGRMHPAVIEARQQRVALSRLIASMRLPEDLSVPVRRPQHRGAARGTYLRAIGE
jgi:hypothetical protein